MRVVSVERYTGRMSNDKSFVRTILRFSEVIARRSDVVKKEAKNLYTVVSYKVSSFR